jgi:branched-chain amino acid transport system ATP-binding protein
LRADFGAIVFAVTDIIGAASYRLSGRGIARTFQIVQPFGSLTVAENIAVGCHLSRPARTDALAAAHELAQTVGLGDLVERRAADLTLAALKRLELARALAIEPRLLLLDEVLTGLNPAEIAEVLPLIRAIRGRGTTIILIEHVMQAVMSLADEVLVLAEGRIITNGAPAAVASNPSVIEAYLGRGAAGRTPAAAQSNG